MTAREKFEAQYRCVSTANKISGACDEEPRGLVAALIRLMQRASNSFPCFTRLCEKAAATSALRVSFTPMLDECCAKGLD
ncbi:MAG TPA: hypothetical protein PLR41_09525 [Alphaproteobacteria bacterium]|nr:hypothetical protein [Alphaproteobacteria bacterium]